MEGGGQVDGQDLVPLLDGEFLHRRDELDAGVVHQDVQPSEGGLGLADHAGDLVGPGHVGGRIDDLHPELPLDP